MRQFSLLRVKKQQYNLSERYFRIANQSLFSCLKNEKIVFLKKNFFPRRSSRPEAFCKKGVLKNFAKFTGKHLRQSLFFNKFVGFRSVTLEKIEHGTDVFLWILLKFQEHFLYRTPPVAASVIFPHKISTMWSLYHKSFLRSLVRLFWTVSLHKKMLSIKDFFSKCDKIRRKLRIGSHLLNKSLMKNLIFYALYFFKAFTGN